MTFGQIIKQKRKEKDWTQEELAGMLRVSAQAVSRWETGDAMPDIMLLAPIANLLEVSTDTLLGVDLSKKKQLIQAYIDRDEELKHQAYTKELSAIAVENLREGLGRFPDSDEIRRALILRLYASGEEEDIHELNQLCEEIFAHTDTPAKEIPLLAILCSCAKRTGNEKRALEWIAKLPYISATTEELRARCLEGEEQDKAYRYVLHSAYVNLSGALFHFYCKKENNTPEEILRYRRIAEQIDAVLYCDDITTHSARDAYQVARALSKAGDIENAVEYILRELTALENDSPIVEISDLRPDTAFQRDYYAAADPMVARLENADMARFMLKDMPEAMSKAVLNHPKMPEIRERLTALASLLDKA